MSAVCPHVQVPGPHGFCLAACMSTMNKDRGSPQALDWSSLALTSYYTAALFRMSTVFFVIYIISLGNSEVFTFWRGFVKEL